MTEETLGVRFVLRQFRWQIVVTWVLVGLENLFLAVMPLFIGRAIDSLLEHRAGALFELAGLMTALVVLATLRRVYDTRAYGTMRVRLGSELVSRSNGLSVSILNARLGMSRELVDFLEAHVPELITAVVQVTISVIILWSFGVGLGVSALGALCLLALIYALFHQRFYQLNSELNAHTERQVSVLNRSGRKPLIAYLLRLRRCEVALSDAEAGLYSLVYLGMFALILTNLWLASQIANVSAGGIFAILSYSWELVESGVALPVIMQQWSRLSEIQNRLNGNRAAEPQASTVAG